MLHTCTKFRGNQPTSRSGEEDFLRVFIIYRHDVYLGRDQEIANKIPMPLPKEAPH